ncbi:hypothetical protein GOV03_04355 [Candidatus Woesearchaeota archaeon]|nr:hypothetical protein [Candidatus Woesearchaeota archaeon]
MLDQLKDLYHNKSIAVLGSAPSVKLFNHQEHRAIGVNGAGCLLTDNDFFFSGDQIAYQRSWFTELPDEVTCILLPTAAIYSPKFYPNDEVRNSLIQVYESYMDRHPEEVFWKEGQGIRCVLPGNEYIDDFFSQIVEPAKPHLILRDISTTELISRDQKLINFGGTSACMALQIAYVMGAREIHLYGIEFSNPVEPDSPYQGDNYFYTPKEGETGMTGWSQRIVMDYVIEEIIQQGTPVISHGPTNLENSIQLTL